MPKIMLNSVEYTGGGGDNGMELTYDEYLALPEEEKANGTTYYIKDVNGIGGDQFQPIIYSEEEREIGVWTDGKPLYQKTIHTGALTKDSDWHTIPHNISNIDKIVSYKGTVYTAGGEIFPIPNYRPPYQDGICLGATSTDIEYIQNWLNTSPDSYVTLQYTKTTDQPGSGTWTPQGVPAHHYSTDEQIVGTWTDGNTLYEKTYEITITCPANTRTDILTLTNENIISLEGRAYYPSNSMWYTSPYDMNINQYNNNKMIICTHQSGGHPVITLVNSGFSNAFDKVQFTTRYTKTTN